MPEIFARNVPGMTEKLKQACIGIAGCGGLGSNAAMALVRAGIGRLILVDPDHVELSNLNRQYFFQQDVGRFKTEALAAHLLNVNPSALLQLHTIVLTPDNLCSIFEDADILIEAFDQAEQKLWLLQTWTERFPDRPVISGNGLSGSGKTNAMRVTRVGSIYFCGDLETDMSMGLCSARVAIAANMQANVAIELIMNGSCHDHD